MQLGKRLFSIALTSVFLTGAALTQEPIKQNQKQTLAPAAGSNPVVGSGTPGYVSKWQGVSGSSNYSLGNSNIFEDKFGKVGIGGPPSPTSLLTVQGMIETLDGYKFPDGTVQTTSSAGALFGVAHDATLQGDGTSASPLGVASPLLVRDLDNPARQPVQFLLLITDERSISFTVPEGKRLVIEFVSGDVTTRVPEPQLPERAGARIVTTVGSRILFHAIVGERFETTYAISQTVKLYSDPGTLVRLLFFGGDIAHSVQVTVSGYFVDVP